MPNKTIYVRETDMELWEKAEEHAGKSLSSLLTEALRHYLEEIESREDGMEAIVVWLGEGELAREAEFVGRWLLEPDEDETRTGEADHDAGAYYGVALTQRGKIAVYCAHCNDGWAPRLNVYDSFDDAGRNYIPKDILASAASAAGMDYRQKMDI